MHRPQLILPLLGLAFLAACQSSSSALRPRLDLPPVPDHAERAAPFDIESYSVQLEVDVAAGRLQGLAHLRLWAKESCAQVELRLAALIVQEVRAQAGFEASFTQTDDVLRITYDPPLPAGSATELVIRYGGTPGRGVRLGPQAAFSRADVPGAHTWMPVARDPAERALLDLELTLPAGWSSVASGLRVDARALQDERRLETWRQRLPSSSLEFRWAAGPSAPLAAGVTGVALVAPVRCGEYLVVYEAAAHECRAQLDALFPAGPGHPPAPLRLICLAGLSAPYPPGVLPLESIGNSALRRDLPAADAVRSAVVRAWVEERLSPASWRDLWLEDALVESLIQLTLDQADAAGVRSTLRRRDLRRKELGAERRGLARPLSSAAFRTPDELIVGDYVDSAGALRLSLLRSFVGEQAFLTGLQLFLAGARGAQARWTDLVEPMAQAAEMDLASFEAQWVMGSGHPELELGWRWDSFGERILLSVKQTQTLAANTPQAFVFPLWVSWRDSVGWRTQSFEVTERRELFELHSVEAPTWLRFDPLVLLPARARVERRIEEWLAMAEASEDGLARISALEALVALYQADPSQEQRQQIASVAFERARADELAQVRVPALRLCGVIGGPEARTLLEKAARSEPSAAARVAALDALVEWGRGPLGRGPELAALAEEIHRVGFSPAVQGAAVALRLACAGADCADWYDAHWRAAVEQPALQAAMVRAAGASRQAWALERIVHLLEDSNASETLRTAALVATAPGVAQSQYLRRVLWKLIAAGEPEPLAEAAVLVLLAHGPPHILAELEKHYDRLPSPRARRAVEAASRRVLSNARQAAALQESRP